MRKPTSFEATKKPKVARLGTANVKTLRRTPQNQMQSHANGNFSDAERGATKNSKEEDGSEHR
jgi:hypothetical protein